VTGAHWWLVACAAQLLGISLIHDLRFHGTWQRARAWLAGQVPPPVPEHHHWWVTRPRWLRIAVIALALAGIGGCALVALAWPLLAALYLQADVVVAGAGMAVAAWRHHDRPLPGPDPARIADWDAYTADGGTGFPPAGYATSRPPRPGVLEEDT
jgi:hypothetical protein